MAVFDTFGIVSQITDGHVPTAYLLTLLAILFTASSYGQMVRVYPYSGSAYTFTHKAISPLLGFFVGWTALLDYVFLPMINALLTKIYLSSLFTDVPGWMWIVGFVLFITLINAWGNNVLVSVNAVLVIFQFSVVVIFVLLAIRGLVHGEGTGSYLSMRPFYSENMHFMTLLTGASILCFSFLGFDAVTTLTEETVNPTKTIPRAIFLVALLGGTLFITASYFTQSLFPDLSRIHNPEAASPEIAYYIGGMLFQSVFLAAALTSTIASGLASQVSASRLLYAMGRDNVLPRKVFGYLHPSLKTPLFNIVLIGGISLLSLFLDLLTATSFINFGALIAFTFVNLSVISHFMIREGKRGLGNMLRYLISPVLGSSFVLFLWFNLEPMSIYIGVSWTLVGVLYLMVKTKMFKEALSFTFDESGTQ